MKLVEILAKVVSEWPKGAGIAVQDGDASKTVKFGHSTAAPAIALMGRENTWQANNWNFNAYSDFDHSVLAADWETSIVTEFQWKAERDKQKGGEWKRHRGGKQPVADGVTVDVKFNDGTQRDGKLAEHWEWRKEDADPRITQYRIISQPQAEEVEVNAYLGDSVKLEISHDGVNFSEIGTARIDNICDLGPAEPQWQQSTGPLAWRDTIIHCQAIIEDCEREIKANVNLLDSEGLFMQLEPKKGMQAYDVPVPLHYSEWQDGDIVRCIEVGISCADLTLGNEYTVVTRHGEIGVIDDIDDHMRTCIECGELEFIRRP